MYLILHTDAGIVKEVVDIGDSGIQVEEDYKKVQWINGGLRGLNIPFIIVPDDPQLMKGDDLPDIVISNDVTEQFLKVDENKELRNELNQAIAELTTLISIS
ncbi:hypothetical protein [Halobacillus sp. BBL2006]|uniref:hypothetical protein n=1 Tax=Halobacillus sp. BBL2006 TaxID=1543706 RepID=UPI000542EB40|nr:hypothetical protein [Halobacillus sp. BBL2006]KHE73143.1 hypothetical protein LD39_00690 [Halobacillus sp. BBL2006]